MLWWIGGMSKMIESELPKYKVPRGRTPDGKIMLLKIDPYVQKVLDKAKERNKKGYDYVSIICGYPGVGKSVFAQTCARYLDPDFDESKVAFGDEEFIDKTNNAKEYSSVVLDESFQSMNSKVTMSSAFLRIVNHLQIIRQKHLFIFLCLPNFFDLSKGVGLYRANHLFLIYADKITDKRRFVSFDRDNKRILYVKGGKFMNYNAHKGNFYGNSYLNEVIPEKIYDDMKRKHLLAQDIAPQENKTVQSRDRLVFYLKEKCRLKIKELAEITKLSESGIKHILYARRGKEKYKV